MAVIKQWSGTSIAVAPAVLSGSRIPHSVNHQKNHIARLTGLSSPLDFRVDLLFLLLPMAIGNINTIINVFVSISVFFKSHRTSQSIKDSVLQVSK
ncbi:hypothetical protein SAY87_017609 [Trapa incisa]|uniref:Uncharacterized protein n=2 Tax=Trapa TaxID=22665 RepID=A0AAN7LP51_TRANT|nr:hypothetical protein SAY87_017609 [Trapa incisa]KAK4784855.1 hypothetical protein SAY86_019223 [Trapa natans]